MLIIFPFGVTIVGTLYIRMFFKLRTKLSMLTGILWILYSIYEYLMYIRVLCTGECNIRVDLLLIYPLLIALSLISIILYYRKKAKLTKGKSRGQITWFGKFYIEIKIMNKDHCCPVNPFSSYRKPSSGYPVSSK